MSLNPAGSAAVASALSGHVGLLSGDREVDGMQRQYVSFVSPREVTFGPARRRVEITGIAVFQDGMRILTAPLSEPRRLALGQSLRLSVTLDATVGG